MNDSIRNSVNKAAIEFGLEPEALLAFIDVETGGQGFNPTNGKLIIQFEPVWFKRNAPYAPSGL